jgi:hypothetical protein
MITCERCQTENVDGAQYCDECGLPLAGAAGRAAAGGVGRAVEARTPILQMLNKPLTVAGGDAETSTAAEVVSPDAPTKHDGNLEGNPSPIVVSEAASALRTSAAVRATPVTPVTAAARNAGASHVAHAALVINRGRSAGKEFPVHEDEAYIGRWDADSGIFPDVDLDSDDPEAKVSRRHARITRRGGQYYIEDLGSTNGTFINRGRRLLPGDRQPLNDGDEIIIGKTFLRFHVTK